MADDRVYITLRDVYDAVQAADERNRAWQESHQARDNSMFTNLNIKFYGLLAGMLTILVALVAAIRP